MNKWVSVNNTLPPHRTKVLVAYKNGVTIAERDGYLTEPKKAVVFWRGVHGSKHQLKTVTHWMYLPNHPNRENERMEDRT